MKTLVYSPILIGVLLSLSFLSRAQTVYVDLSASGLNNGSSWTNAFTSLAAGIDSAWQNPSVDSILVAKGTYKPDSLPYNMQSNKKGIQITSTDNQDKSFHIRPGLALIGGYPSGGGNPDIVNNPTILSGNKVGGVANDTAYTVVLIDSPIEWGAISDSTLIEGITITEGSALGSGSITVNGNLVHRDYGGGVYAIKATTTIKKVTIIGNSADVNGAGLYTEACNISIFNSTISSNVATG